jgi:hypothetical protein
MNGRYDAILQAASWAGATLTAAYDGDHWTATVAAHRRKVSAEGATLELALTQIEEELGMERWRG